MLGCSRKSCASLASSSEIGSVGSRLEHLPLTRRPMAQRTRPYVNC